MRKFYLLLPLIVVLFSAYSGLSQTPSGVNSIRLIGSGAHESFKKIIPVTNGYLLIGDRDVSHAGEDTAINNEINDVWVVKTNTVGTVEWEKSFGGSGTEIGYSGVATHDNGFLILATTNSYLNDGDVTGHHGYGSQIEGDETDIWILKLNNQGDLEWAKTYGGARADLGYSIIQGSDGYYMIAGETKSWDGQLTGQRKSNILPNPAVDQDTDKDAWLFKINLTGNIVWQRCYGGNANEDAHSIIEEPGVGFTIAGYTNSSDIDLSGVTAHGGSDAWIFRINNSGTIGLNKTYGGSKHEEFTKVVSYNGKYYAGGRTTSNDGDVVGYHPSAPEWEWVQYPDIWLVEFAPAGNILQQTCRGTGSFEELTDMLVLPGLGIYLLEFWDGDGMLENFDFAFNLVDRSLIKQELQSMAATPGGGLYLAGGHFPSYDAPLDLPFNGGSADGLLMRYGKLVAVITAVSPLSGPANTTVTIKGKNFSPVASGNIVYFGANKATVTNANDTVLTVLAPPNSANIPISVTTSNRLTSYYNSPFLSTFDGSTRLNRESFAARQDYGTGQDPWHIATGDVDGDGKSDLVLLDLGQNIVSVYRSISEEGMIDFAGRIDLMADANAYEVLLADLDGDGRKDIIVASNGLVIHKNISTPGVVAFAPAQRVIPGNTQNSVRVGDINGDGLPDLAISYRDRNLATVLRNTSAGGVISFTDVIDLPLLNRPIKLILNDFNQDGRADIAIIKYNETVVSVYNSISSPDSIAFAPVLNVPAPVVPNYLNAGDIDGDKKPDIVIMGTPGSNIRVYQNTTATETPTFADQVVIPIGFAWETIELADLNGDAKLDIVAGLFRDSISVMENKSQNGVIDFYPSFSLGTTALGSRYATTGDFDNDGKADIATLTYNTNTLSVFRNKMAEAQVIPSGTNPVTGSMTNKVTIDPTVQTYQGHPYVQRHYDVTPANDPATATATLTLYFTQQEFDNYNAHPAHGLDLPHHAGDNLNKANLRVYQYHGFSTTSLPGSYSGNGVEIDPDNAKIVWNAVTLQWEVTFDVNGFSGFFLGTANNSLLPVTLLSFTGNVKEQKVLLQWTTTREINVTHFEIQHRDNNSDFMTIGKITAAGSNNLEYDYQYSDALGTSPVYYYRLKIVDIDQSATYSKTITIRSSSGNAGLVLNPNPAKEYVIVKHPAKNALSRIRIVDMFGKTLKTVTVASNSMQTRIVLGGLPKGSYTLVWDGEAETTSQVLILQ